MLSYFDAKVLFQVSAYQACDCMCTSLHTPKTLQTHKKRHTLFDSKSLKMWQITLLKQHIFYLSLFINVLTIIFEVMKKENNAAVLTIKLADANLKTLLY